jgi:hypothetical protein
MQPTSRRANLTLDHDHADPNDSRCAMRGAPEAKPGRIPRRESPAQFSQCTIQEVNAIGWLAAEIKNLRPAGPESKVVLIASLKAN